MQNLNGLICITSWLFVVLGGTTPYPQKTTPPILTNPATVPDLILRFTKAKAQPKVHRRKSISHTTTSPYIPKRLTDPPSTEETPQRLTDPASTYVPKRLTDRVTEPTPRRLTDPPTVSTEPISTEYELSVTPVVLPPRKLKSPESIRDDCVQVGIVPDLLEDIPPYPMQVRYLFELVPKFGNALDPKDLIYRPYYVVWPNNKTDFYSLVLLDIDYPSRSNPSLRSYLHWQVVNIRGDDWIRADCSSEYIGPNPLYGSGFHRYMFLVFKQPSFINFKDLRYPKMRLDEHRANYSVHRFIRKYKLKLHAMNFFLAQSQVFHFTYSPISKHHRINEIEPSPPGLESRKRS